MVAAPPGRVFLLILAVCIVAPGVVFAQPGPPRPRDDQQVSAVLLGKIEHSFTHWLERVSGRGDEAVFDDVSDRRRRRMTWAEVSQNVTQVIEFDVTLAGRLFVVAQFTMDNKPEYRLADRLQSVGGLYPAVFTRGAWKTIGVEDGGFHVNEKIGPADRPSLRQFTYQGRPGEKQIRVTGKGLDVQPGKYRLQVMAAMAKDWAAWFPADANVYVYFVPSLPPPPAGPATELQIGSISRPAGSIVTVPITLRNANRLGDLNATLSYPARLLRLEAVEKGTLVGPGVQLVSEHDQAAGRVGIALASRAGITGHGELAVLRFRIVGSAGQRDVLSMRVTSSHRTDDQPIAIRVSEGQVAVQGMLGDGDGDGRITSRDALMALQFSAKPDDGSGGQVFNPALDIDGDGSVTAKDARWLLMLSVGIRPPGYTGPVGDGTDGDLPE